MNIHHHSKVNPLFNPVSTGDIVISETGEKYQVIQNMAGDYWLRHVKDKFDITSPVSGQIAICRQIAGLIDL